MKTYMDARLTPALLPTHLVSCGLMSFLFTVEVGPLTISPSQLNRSYVGENIELECSIAIGPNPLPQNVPRPSIVWLSGPNNATLPTGVEVSEPKNDSGVYVSTLQFHPVQECHSGNYTCRLQNNEMLRASVAVYTCKYNQDGYYDEVVFIHHFSKQSIFLEPNVSIKT